MNRIVITHADLDGVGCAFLLARCFPVDNLKFVTRHSELHDLIIALKDVPPSEVWITDLSIHKKTAKLLANTHHDINYVDHHNTSVYLKDMYDWAFVDTGCSATLSLWRILSSKFELQDFEGLITTIDDYDCYGYEANEPSIPAQHLNALQLILGPFLMLKRLHNKPSPKITDNEAQFIAASIYKDEQYIQNVHDPIEATSSAGKFLLVCCERCTSKIGNLLLHDNPDVEFIVLPNYNTRTIGLRGRGDFNLSLLAKYFNGGGHPKAAGFELPTIHLHSPNQIKELIANACTAIVHKKAAKNG